MAGRVVICLTGLAAAALIAAGAGSGRPGIVSADEQVYTILAAGGQARQVTQGDLAAQSPSWSSDGSRLAYVQGSRIVVCSLGSGTTKSVVFGLVGNDSPAWSPDGRRIAFTGLTSAEGVARISVVASIGSKPKVLASTPRGTGHDQRGPARIVVRLSSIWGASWSPDGKMIAFTGGRPGELRTHLYVVRPDGSGLRRLTGEVTSSPPTWSPNSKLIAFGSYEPGIDVIAPDGTGRRTVVAIPDADISHLARSPNGKTIAFGARRQPQES